MKIDINKNVYDLVTENPQIKDKLIDLGFKPLSNPIMFNTMAKKMSIKRGAKMLGIENIKEKLEKAGFEVIDCLLYTSDAADEEDSVDLGGRRIIKKKKKKKFFFFFFLFFFFFFFFKQKTAYEM